MTCNTQVTINNAVGWCDICENAESQSDCKLTTCEDGNTGWKWSNEILYFCATYKLCGNQSMSPF